MPLYDFKCPRCGALKTIYVQSVTSIPMHIWCENVDGGCSGLQQMVRQPSAPAFIVTGFSAKNGYSKEGA